MSTKSKTISVAQIQKKFGDLSFGRLLKSHRLGEELSQVEMAKHLNISKQSLNDLEQGRKIPSIRRAIDISKKIGILNELAIQLVLQDQIKKENLRYTVSVRKNSVGN